MTLGEIKEQERLHSGLSGWPLLIVSAVIGGVAGVLAVASAHWAARHGGLDSPDKHGISSVQASRVGGVLIFTYVLFSVFYHYLQNGEWIAFGSSLWVLGLTSIFFTIGLFEDLKGTLSARLRLMLMLIIVAMLLALNQDFLIQPAGLPMIDWLLSHAWLAAPITLLCLVFLPNAFNAADGANGLVASISLIIFVALSEAQLGALNLLLAIAAVGCLIFLAYNLVTSKVYLGDGGAYFLGALAGSAVIAASNAGELPTWYLLALIFYPTADFIWSIARRSYARLSPLAADEQHLHNLLYGLLRRLTGWTIPANTLTGVGIALVFAGVPYVTWWISTDTAINIAWEWFYGLQWLIYVGAWFLLRLTANSKS